jgi:Fe2+ transport system protein FeoA
MRAILINLERRLNAIPAIAIVEETHSLAELHKGDRAVVVEVLDDDAVLGDDTGGTVVMRLIEIGFVAGEIIEVIGESRPGGDPIAVRVGGTCFALRRREAAAVMVTRLPAARP